MDLSDSQLLTVPEVASLLGLSPKTIRKYINEKKIPAIRMGKKHSRYLIPAAFFNPDYLVGFALRYGSVDEWAKALQTILRDSVSEEAKENMILKAFEDKWKL